MDYLMGVPQYAIAPAPRFAAMRTWDCTRCGREEVRPVFLTAGTPKALPYGTGCAALLLGRPAGAARKVRDEADAADRAAARHEALLADRRTRYTVAAAALAAGDHEVPELACARQTFHRSGGFAALGTFPAWVAAVAATGDLTPATQLALFVA